MKQAVWGLVILAAVAFLIGSVCRFLPEGEFLGYRPVMYWRGAIGFLAFAITLLLTQIRDQR